jgi:hypothetical protein
MLILGCTSLANVVISGGGPSAGVGSAVGFFFEADNGASPTKVRDLLPRVRVFIPRALQLILGHHRVADSQENLLVGYLIAEAFPNMSRYKGLSTIVECQESVEVDKVALGRFRAKVRLELASWPNLRFEHQIELFGFSKLFASIRQANLLFWNQFSQSRARIIVDLGEDGMIALQGLIREFDQFRFSSYSPTCWSPDLWWLGPKLCCWP